jgi:hypothetical protein
MRCQNATSNDGCYFSINLLNSYLVCRFELFGFVWNLGTTFHPLVNDPISFWNGHWRGILHFQTHPFRHHLAICGAPPTNTARRCLTRACIVFPRLGHSLYRYNNAYYLHLQVLETIQTFIAWRTQLQDAWGSHLLQRWPSKSHQLGDNMW